LGGNDGMVQVVIVVEEKKNAEKAYFFFEKLFRLDCGRIVFRVFEAEGKNQGKLQKKISELCFTVILSQVVEHTYILAK
jgi:hypothetical protein